MLTYHYKDLDSLADHFWNKAQGLRAQIGDAKRLHKAELLAEACAYESVAFTLRATTLGGVQAMSKIWNTCSICGGPLYEPNAHWKGGNNAQPVNDGRCCDNCQRDVVVPARVLQAYLPSRPEGRWGIWCEVWGGVTGRRSAWAKANGKLLTFKDRKHAEAQAAHMAKANDNPHRTATFAYSVRPLPAIPSEPDPDRKHDAKRNGDLA